MSEFVFDFDSADLEKIGSFEASAHRIIKRDVPVYTIKKGQNKLLLLPPRKDRFYRREGIWKVFGITIFYHPRVTPLGDSYPCPRVMLGEECPLCNKYYEAKTDDERSLYRPRLRGAIWVVDMTDEETIAKGAQLWLFGWAKDTFNALSELVRDPETGEVLPIYKEPRVLYFKGVEQEDRFNSVKMVAPRFGNNVIKYREEWLEGVKKFEDIIDFAEVSTLYKVAEMNAVDIEEDELPPETVDDANESIPDELIDEIE